MDVDLLTMVVLQSGIGTAGVDRKLPSRADRIPVQLVMIAEEADLTRGPIMECKSVSRRYRQEIIVARVDADAVVQRLGKPGFGDTVTLHAEHVETDDHAIAVAIPVTGGKVAIDAAPDILAGSLHGNFFGHIEASIALDMHIDPVIENAFFGLPGQRVLLPMSANSMLRC